jgi:hypothetical protein
LAGIEIRILGLSADSFPGSKSLAGAATLSSAAGGAAAFAAGAAGAVDPAEPVDAACAGDVEPDAGGDAGGFAPFRGAKPAAAAISDNALIVSVGDGAGLCARVCAGAASLGGESLDKQPAMPISSAAAEKAVAEILLRELRRSPVEYVMNQPLSARKAIERPRRCRPMNRGQPEQAVISGC